MQGNQNKTDPENVSNSGTKLTLVNEQENCPLQMFLEMVIADIYASLWSIYKTVRHA